MPRSATARRTAARSRGRLPSTWQRWSPTTAGTLAATVPRRRSAAQAATSPISPALHADQISIPLLIVHGAKDERVPVAQARGFVARLKKAGKVEGRDFTYLEQSENTHNLLREEDRRGLLNAMKSFLGRHNPV
ncbi:alpha/beta hydrolase family protein [Sphingomonas guangdongensis]|uniref:alpha/beta hydrolase family protein n=1 Tax=Sphingomonas guangdongensis TaxID=1141890 RepID=UPI003CCB974F